MAPVRPLVVALLLLAGCREAAETDAVARATGSGMAAGETLHFTGTEPFWSGEASGSRLTWRTAEAPAGVAIPVTRFAGRNGVGFSGMLGAKPFELAASAAPCSDGMSDRSYPFAVTVQLGGETLRGCGWTAARPASEAPQH